LAIGLLFILKLLLPTSRENRTTYIIKDQFECVQIVAGKTFNGKTNILSAFKARAKSNERLVATFGIDNAFTTAESKRHSEYRNKVGPLLTPDWSSVARAAQNQANTYFPGNLVCLVQSFVLKMTINVLFQSDLSMLDNQTISFVAVEINRLWVNSKVPRQTVYWTRQHKLHKALRQLVPGCDPLDPQTNPMNLIIPAFETMWRVVLRCFIEVRYRNSKEMKEWIASLRIYLENPVSLSDHACKEHASITVVCSLVREALRLYPPTRHIHREFEFADSSQVSAVADIEELHRDTNIWGFDAECFRPSRWASTNSEQSKAWMPFGASPFLCPAKPEFGPRMIGILVAALVTTFSDAKYELQREGVRGQMETAEFFGPLNSERHSYEELYLEENAPCA
jgi:hypothetical protein